MVERDERRHGDRRAFERWLRRALALPDFLVAQNDALAEIREDTIQRELRRSRDYGYGYVGLEFDDDDDEVERTNSETLAAGYRLELRNWLGQELRRRATDAERLRLAEAAQPEPAAPDTAAPEDVQPSPATPAPM